LRAQDTGGVAAGKAQFAQTCGFCHGANARGASGPDLIHSTLVSHDVAGNLIGEVVRNGRPAKGMPAFELSDQQVRSIAEYLHSEAKLAYSVYSRGPGDYPLEKLLVGSADAGKKFFYGEGQCATCHSTTGDLAHVARKYKPVDLQSRIAYPSGAVPAVTVTDSFGKVCTGPETYSDEFIVSLRDSSGWIHTFERDKVKVEIKNPLEGHEHLLSVYSDANLHDLFAYLETLQ
jgi:cytochrome c oxidase cbb3-type subunit 3